MMAVVLEQAATISCLSFPSRENGCKIPVTVITGFLGGKTTLIRHLLQHNQGRRIAVQ